MVCGKREEGRWKMEEGRRKKEEGRRKREEGRGKREEGIRKMEDGRGREEGREGNRGKRKRDYTRLGTRGWARKKIVIIIIIIFFFTRRQFGDRIIGEAYLNLGTTPVHKRVVDWNLSGVKASKKGKPQLIHSLGWIKSRSYLVHFMAEVCLLFLLPLFRSLQLLLWPPLTHQNGGEFNNKKKTVSMLIGNALLGEYNLPDQENQVR
jgi:hypothetical protein